MGSLGVPVVAPCLFSLGHHAMAPYAELIAMALNTVLLAHGRDAIPMDGSPLTGVALRTALVALRAIALHPAVTLVAVRRIFLLLEAVNLQPIRGLMIFRQRFLCMACRAGIARLFTVVALITGYHRRLVSFGGLGVMNQPSVAIDAFQPAQLGMRVVRNKQISGWRYRPFRFMTGVATFVAGHLYLAGLGRILCNLHKDQLYQIAAKLERVPKTLFDVAFVTRHSGVRRLLPGIIRTLLEVTADTKLRLIDDIP